MWAAADLSTSGKFPLSLQYDRPGLCTVRLSVPQRFHEMVKKLMQSFANRYVILPPSSLLNSVLLGVFPVIALCSACCVSPPLKYNTAQSASQRHEQSSQDVLFQCRIRKMFLDSPSISGSSVISAGEKFLPRDEEGELFPTTVSVPSLYCGQGL